MSSSTKASQIAPGLASCQCPLHPLIDQPELREAMSSSSQDVPSALANSCVNLVFPVPGGPTISNGRMLSGTSAGQHRPANARLFEVKSSADSAFGNLLYSEAKSATAGRAAASKLVNNQGLTRRVVNDVKKVLTVTFAQGDADGNLFGNVERMLCGAT